MLHSLAKTPLPPHTPHLGSYTRTLLVSQDRRHIYVTPCYWRILKKTIVYSGFRKSLQKNPRNKKSGQEKRIRAWEDSSLCPETKDRSRISSLDTNQTGLFIPDTCVALLLGYYFRACCSDKPWLQDLLTVLDYISHSAAGSLLLFVPFNPWIKKNTKG
jgi:hypothetical protein